MKTKQDMKVSNKINAIRQAAGNPGCVCPTCMRSAADPYRRLVNGKVSEGCVDAFHTNDMQVCTTSAAWHNRPVAVQMRKAELVRLVSL